MWAGESEHVRVTHAQQGTPVSRGVEHHGGMTEDEPANAPVPRLVDRHAAAGARDPRRARGLPARHRPAGDRGVAGVLRRRARPAGQQRARYLMLRLLERARERHVGVPSLTSTDYVNTIPTEREPWFPGDEETERAYRRWIRWNAAMMVHRAQRPGVGVGGHISTYASSATLYEVGFNHFFRGKDHPGGGDQVFIQGHASPGIYARAFLEGRLSDRPARRVPPGALPRRPRARAAVLPAPAADAGLLGVPHRLDGPRADERDLAGAVQPLPARPRHSRTPPTSTSGRSSATARWTSRSPAA